VPELTSLVRTMQHTHATSTTAANVQIEDTFRFSSAQSFEVALTTLGSYAKDSHELLRFTHKDQTLLAKIETSAPWTLVEEVIDEEGLVFTRIGIRLQKPATTGFVKVTFTEAN
ncbi:MAG: hypothetical protein ACRCYY_18040, partial [Trueperaceae bacterium]